MNENQTPRTMKDAAVQIEAELADFTVNLFKKKPEIEKVPSRFNLYAIGVAAFVMLTMLDLIAAIVTGSITNFLYGILVFSIGVGSLVVSELGYFFPYASRNQKIISVVDGILSIGSTLLIGVLAAVVYAVIKFEILPMGNAVSIIEVVLMALLVIIAVIHAVLWISYVLIDNGVQMYQNYVKSKASSKIRHDGFKLAESNMNDQIAIGQSMKRLVDQNKGALLDQNIEQITGEKSDAFSMTSRSNGNHP